jgi:hypothetical protein
VDLQTLDDCPSPSSFLGTSSVKMGVLMDENISVPRPSLYLATRLTRLVQEFRRRLQERVQVRKTSTESTLNSCRRTLRRRAFSNFERYTSVHLKMMTSPLITFCRVSRPRRNTISLDNPQPDFQSQSVCVQSWVCDLNAYIASF